jgi:hypothetical protein
MIPAQYNLPTGYKGDTYNSISFNFFDKSGNAINLEGTESNLEVRSLRNRDLVLKWSTFNNSILISNNRLTLQSVSGSNMKMFADTYIYDLEVNKNNKNTTYITGFFPIIDEISL